MARAFLLFIFAGGLFASVLTHAPSQPVKREAPTHINRAEQDQLGSSEPHYSQPLDSSADNALELDRGADGHFYADVEINGARVHMLVDTGASGIALSREDARSAGIATSIGMPGVVGQGADGEVHGEIVALDRVAIGSRTFKRVPAIVLNSGGQSLLGQSLLSQFASVQIAGDRMLLR